MKQFTLEELAGFNGKDGQPVYIAHQGKVYDVSESKLWKGGIHMRRHPAGTDLTTDIQAAPHQADRLDRYPQVGVLVRETADETEKKMPKFVTYLLETNPFFRRHPHPMTVHFPIVFMLSNPFFNILYLITGAKSFETTALHCLVGGLLFSAVAIMTGFLTWWYNYMGKMMKPIAIKIPLSLIVLVIALIQLIWRLVDPGVMGNLQGGNRFYLLLSLSFFPLISIIGWFGASMTFPIEKE